MRKFVLCFSVLVLSLGILFGCAQSKYPIPSEEEFNIYRNGELEITLQDEDDIDFDETQQTFRGIQIGDRAEKVREKYGKEYMINFGTGEIDSIENIINKNKENTGESYGVALQMCEMNGKKYSIDDFYEKVKSGDKVCTTAIVIFIMDNKVTGINTSRSSFVEK